MTSKKIILSFLIVLIILNVSLMMLLKRERQESAVSTFVSLESKKAMESEMDFQSKFTEDYFLSYLSEEFKTRAVSKYPEFLQKTKEGKKIIVFFNESVCGSCLFKVLQDLEILTDQIGEDKIIVTSNMRTDEGEPIKSADFDFPHFYIESFDLEVEKYNQPIIFILQNDLEIRSLYVVELFPDLDFKYFTKILPESF